MKWLEQEILQQVIKKRPDDAHKGTFGRIVLVGGNQQYGGAIIMSTEAAVHAGAGLVTAVTDPANHTALHTRLPEAMVVDWHNQTLMKEVLMAADVVVIGPGLGLDETSQQLLAFVLVNLLPRQFCVIDGSAITLFAEGGYPLPVPQNCVFTPHQMEWQRLSGIPINEQTESANLTEQQQLQATVVVKSHRTEIYGQTEVVKNPLGSPAMATGGMGDTLAGMIGAFLAQFKDQPEQAIQAAVYLHSYLGSQLGNQQYVALPTQISAMLPMAMKQFEA